MIEQCERRDYRAELDRYLARLEGKLPPRVARFSAWLREPSSRMVRLPVAGLLVLGGIFSFLPVFGIWMLPLGLLLFAQDMPILEKPMAKGLGWIERRWRNR